MKGEEKSLLTLKTKYGIIILDFENYDDSNEEENDND